MNDTDFDLLCEGTSPEEAKRLRKLLAQWCVGDENSFPVQFALLTRAQWRVAAKVPLLVNQSRQQMEITFADQRQQNQALLGKFLQHTDSHLESMKTTLTAHHKAVEKSVADVNISIGYAERVAGEIESNLQTGARNLEDARIAFQKEQERLVAIAKELSTRLTWWQWFCIILLFVLAMMIGVLLDQRFFR